MLKVKTHEKQFLNVTGETYGVKKKIEYYQQRNLYYMYKYLNKKKKNQIHVLFDFHFNERMSIATPVL